MSALWVLFVLAAALVAIELVTPAYYVLLRRAARREPEPIRGGSPTVTVLVPAYNEEGTIRGRLENLRADDYPRKDVIVVDDCSSDRTVDIVKEFQRDHPDFPLRIIEKPERGGKVSGIRAALPHATGELVCMSDADSLWSPGALRAAVERFADPRVGAVMGLRDLMRSRDGALAAEDDYNAFYNVARLGESALDSTPTFCGPLSVYRREFMDAATFAEGALLADDSETAVRVRRAGLRTVAEPRARFREGALASMRGYRLLRARRGTGLQDLFLRNWDIAFRPRTFGRFSLIVAANLVMLVLAPLATVALAVVTPILLWMIGGPVALAAGLGGGGALVAAALTAKRGPFALAGNYLQTQLALLWGLWMLRRRRNPIYDHVDGVRSGWEERAGAE